MNYYDKYIKYKNKYDYLIKYIGGSDYDDRFDSDLSDSDDDSHQNTKQKIPDLDFDSDLDEDTSGLSKKIKSEADFSSDLSEPSTRIQTGKNREKLLLDEPLPNYWQRKHVHDNQQLNAEEKCKICDYPLSLLDPTLQGQCAWCESLVLHRKEYTNKLYNRMLQQGLITQDEYDNYSRKFKPIPLGEIRLRLLQRRRSIELEDRDYKDKENSLRLFDRTFGNLFPRSEGPLFEVLKPKHMENEGDMDDIEWGEFQSAKPLSKAAKNRKKRKKFLKGFRNKNTQ